MDGRFLVLVTGSSRGFGRCVAEEFVRQVAPSNAVDLVLVARSGPGLESVAGAIDVITTTIPDVQEVVVRRVAFDLGDLERLDDHLNDVFKELDPSRYARAVLVNNAASLGYIGYANELPSLATLRSEMDFNFTSAIWVSSRFAAAFGARSLKASKEQSNAADTSRDEVRGRDRDGAAATMRIPDASNNLVVNVSSLAASKPFKTWAGYGASRAGRQMFHRVLAAEQMEVGGLKVLNYGPGPMGTDMARELRSQAEYEMDVISGRLVDPKISAEKCVRLVVTGRFESGAHVEFSDSENTVA